MNIFIPTWVFIYFIVGTIVTLICMDLGRELDPGGESVIMKFLEKFNDR